MAPTKTRPLLWLLPAFAAAQSSCHKSRKGVRCNNRTGRDRRCWADEKCGRGAAEPVVPTFAALDRCRRPRCAACGSGAPPVLYGEFHADGVGVTLGNAFRMADLAYRNNYSFGGVVRLPDKRNANGHGTLDWRVLALTTDAALLHMAHWSTADVFLAGHSSFSSIPALLNPNCVMAPMYTPNSAKRACVARLARARAAELSRA